MIPIFQIYLHLIGEGEGVGVESINCFFMFNC